jgi:hypothetical protein
MNDDRRRILDMLSEGKITVDEADRLLAAMNGPARAGTAGAAAAEPETPKAPPKYLRVAVNTEDGHDGPTNVNIRVPMQLLRAGVRLSSIIPPYARDKANAAMRAQGIDVDLNQLKPENLEAMIEQLSELTVDVDQERTKVRVYCE